MRLPLNTIHWYLVLPFLAVIAWRSFSARRISQNKLNFYFGLSALSFFLAMLCYGLLPLLAEPTSIWLTYGTIAGDILQFIALAWLWLAVVRIYLPGKRLARIAVIVCELILIMAGVYFSIAENMAHPVTMLYVDGVWQIDFAFSQGYQIVTAIQYGSLLLLGIRFMLQGRSAVGAYKKLRLFSLAILFVIVGGMYVLRPILSIDVASNSFSYIVAIIHILVAIFLVVSMYLASHKKDLK